MPQTVETTRPLLVTAEGGRYVIVVPLARAEKLQTQLRERGIGTTIVVMPYEKEARLELWRGLDPGRVQAALDELPKK